MGFRFRRSMKIAPGFRLNITHRGAGMRIGPKGAGVSVNTSGRNRVSAGIYEEFFALRLPGQSQRQQTANSH